MLLPTTYAGVMLAITLAAVLWGLWVNTVRIDKKWRFELYAYDFAAGGLLMAVILAFTLGNTGSSATFTFEDNLTIAGKRNMAIAAGAGVLFCLGNLLSLAGMTLAGMSTAMPVAAGFTMIVATIFHLAGGHDLNPSLVYGGAGAALLAIIVSALAQRQAAVAAPVKKKMHPGWKGFILSAVGGVFLGLYFPTVESSQAGDIGVGPYTAVVFIALGSFLITPLFNVYFLNLPVQGQALSIGAYFKGTKKQHLTGVAGGALWACGAVAFFAAVGSLYGNAPKLLALLAAGNGGAILAALCGLAVWGDQAAAPKAKGLVFASVTLLAVGLSLIYAGA